MPDIPYMAKPPAHRIEEHTNFAFTLHGKAEAVAAGSEAEILKWPSGAPNKFKAIGLYCMSDYFTHDIKVQLYDASNLQPLEEVDAWDQYKKIEVEIPGNIWLSLKAINGDTATRDIWGAVVLSTV